MRPLAILRPEPGATATAEAARQLGLEPILMPLFRIEPVAWTAPDPARFDALLITSANTIRHGGETLRKLAMLPVYAVGEATAAAAREASFVVAMVGNGGVDALLGSIPPRLRLLHLSGAERRQPSVASRRIVQIPVYRSAELPLPDRFAAIEEAVIAVHSARAGARLAQLAPQAGIARSRATIAAISAEAAEAAGTGWERVEALDEPNGRALLALAARLCHNGR